MEQHPKRRLLADFSMCELKEMRRSGMTNKEIAEQTGASYATILAHIGKQPKLAERYEPLAGTASPPQIDRLVAATKQHALSASPQSRLSTEALHMRGGSVFTLLALQSESSKYSTQADGLALCHSRSSPRSWRSLGSLCNS